MTGDGSRRPSFWWLLLGAATVARLCQVITEPAYLHPDALHQGLEPAFRAVFGYGQVAWEFREGLRSWTFPALLAWPTAILKSLGLVGPGAGMGLSIHTARVVMVAIDVWTLHLVMTLSLRCSGHMAAFVIGVVGAVHPGFVVMGAQPLVDVLASSLLVAVALEALNSHPQMRSPMRFGALVVVTVLTRVQLAPAVLAACVAAWRLRDWSGDAPRRAVTGAVLAVFVWGLIDWVTLGAPLHSVFAYLRYNLGAGQSAFGVMPWNRYLTHFQLVMPVLSVVSAPLVVLGARRKPWLALIALAVILPHQWVPYKVWRFLHPALWLWTALAAIGWASLCGDLRPALRRLIGGVVLTCALWISWSSGGIWETTWLYHQGGSEAVELSRQVNSAYLALGAKSRVTKVVQTVLPEAGAPGVALLGHPAKVVHPLGRSVPPRSLRGADFWIVKASPQFATWPAEWRSAQGLVWLVRPPR